MGERRVAQVAISSSGAWYAAGSYDGHFAVWQPDHPDQPQLFRITGVTPRSLAFDPGDTQVAIAHHSGLSLVSVAELQPPRHIRADTGFREAAYSPRTGSLLAVTDRHSLEWIGGFSCCGWSNGAAFSPDGSIIATTGAWPALWNTESVKLIGHLTTEGEYAEFGPAAFDKMRGWVIMGSRDGRVYAWDIETAELRGKSEPAGAVDSIAVLKNSPWIAFAMTGAPIHLWNPDTGETRVIEALPYSNVVAGPEPASILFGNYAGSVELWNAETGEVLSRFTLR